MARARRVVTLDEKIDKAQAEVAEAKAKLDKKIDVLEKLLTKRKEMESKELLKAFAESERTLEEVLEFLREDTEEETQDNQE
ncbi:MAG: hypothetical protein IKF90_22230 [Parasporobacterium sp.]|jgi:hypothetical protein|nr:hypothetical protein [Parasporobacterium sp.]